MAVILNPWTQVALGYSRTAQIENVIVHGIKLLNKGGRMVPSSSLKGQWHCQKKRINRNTIRGSILSTRLVSLLSHLILDNIFTACKVIVLELGWSLPSWAAEGSRPPWQMWGMRWTVLIFSESGCSARMPKILGVGWRGGFVISKWCPPNTK